MSEADRDLENAVRERAYFMWEREGRPEGRARDHWKSASTEEARARLRDDDFLEDEEKVLAGRIDANMPALLTKDVHGG